MASRGRSEGATTEHSTMAPASSRPPRSARPGRSSSACGPSPATTVCMPVVGSVTIESGTSAARQREAQHGDHAQHQRAAGERRPRGVERAAVLHDRAAPRQERRTAPPPGRRTATNTPRIQPGPDGDRAGEHPLAGDDLPGRPRGAGGSPGRPR